MDEIREPLHEEISQKTFMLGNVSCIRVKKARRIKSTPIMSDQYLKNFLSCENRVREVDIFGDEFTARTKRSIDRLVCLIERQFKRRKD